VEKIEKEFVFDQVFAGKFFWNGCAEYDIFSDAGVGEKFVFIEKFHPFPDGFPKFLLKLPSYFDDDGDDFFGLLMDDGVQAESEYIHKDSGLLENMHQPVQFGLTGPIQHTVFTVKCGIGVHEIFLNGAVKYKWTLGDQANGFFDIFFGQFANFLVPDIGMTRGVLV